MCGMFQDSWQLAAEIFLRGALQKMSATLLRGSNFMFICNRFYGFFFTRHFFYSWCSFGVGPLKMFRNSRGGSAPHRGRDAEGARVSATATQHLTLKLPDTSLSPKR